MQTTEYLIPVGKAASYDDSFAGSYQEVLDAVKKTAGTPCGKGWTGSHPNCKRGKAKAASPAPAPAPAVPIPAPSAAKKSAAKKTAKPAAISEPVPSPDAKTAIPKGKVRGTVSAADVAKRLPDLGGPDSDAWAVTAEWSDKFRKPEGFTRTTWADRDRFTINSEQQHITTALKAETETVLGVQADPAMKVIAQARGIDKAKPEMAKSVAALHQRDDLLMDRNGKPILLFRGVQSDAQPGENRTDLDYAQGFLKGDYQGGHGVYGNGYYFAGTDWEERIPGRGTRQGDRGRGMGLQSDPNALAAGYAGRMGKGGLRGQSEGSLGNVLTCGIKKNAKIISYVDAEAQMNAEQIRLEKAGASKKELYIAGNVGRWAMMNGYDAIRDGDGDESGIPFYVVLNRSALVASPKVQKVMPQQEVDAMKQSRYIMQNPMRVPEFAGSGVKQDALSGYAVRLVYARKETAWLRNALKKQEGDTPEEEQAVLDEFSKQVTAEKDRLKTVWQSIPGTRGNPPAIDDPATWKKAKKNPAIQAFLDQHVEEVKGIHYSNKKNVRDKLKAETLVVDSAYAYAYAAAYRLVMDAAKAAKAPGTPCGKGWTGTHPNCKRGKAADKPAATKKPAAAKKPDPAPAPKAADKPPAQKRTRKKKEPEQVFGEAVPHGTPLEDLKNVIANGRAIALENGLSASAVLLNDKVRAGDKQLKQLQKEYDSLAKKLGAAKTRAAQIPLEDAINENWNQIQRVRAEIMPLRQQRADAFMASYDKLYGNMLKGPISARQALELTDEINGMPSDRDQQRELSYATTADEFARLYNGHGVSPDIARKYIPTSNTSPDQYVHGVHIWYPKKGEDWVKFPKQIFRAQNTGGYVELADHPNIGFRMDTLHHEFGHSLEHTNPQVMRVALDFRASRSGNRKPVKLRTLTKSKNYGENEKAFPDEFVHPYVGKEYRDSRTGEDRATEVISYGVECMRQRDRAYELFVKDPEHFFIVQRLTRL